MTKKEQHIFDNIFNEYKRAAIFYKRNNDIESERLVQEALHCLRRLAADLSHTITEEANNETNEIKSARQELKEYEEAEQLEYIQRCKKCGSLKAYAFSDECYFNPLRYICHKCKNEWAG